MFLFGNYLISQRVKKKFPETFRELLTYYAKGETRGQIPCREQAMVDG